MVANMSYEPKDGYIRAHQARQAVINAGANAGEVEHESDRGYIHFTHQRPEGWSYARWKRMLERISSEYGPTNLIHSTTHPYVIMGWWVDKLPEEVETENPEFKSGMNARSNGAKITDNPHPRRSTKANLWAKGWLRGGRPVRENHPRINLDT